MPFDLRGNPAHECSGEIRCVGIGQSRNRESDVVFVPRARQPIQQDVLVSSVVLSGPGCLLIVSALVFLIDDTIRRWTS